MHRFARLFPMIRKVLTWHDPLDMADSISRLGVPMACLYSGMQTTFTGSYSWIAWEPLQRFQSWDALDYAIRHGNPDHMYWGGIAYENMDDAEVLKPQSKHYLDPAPFLFYRFAYIIRYNHETQDCELYHEPGHSSEIPSPEKTSDSENKVRSVQSNMTKSEYLQKVSTIQTGIINGDLLQANLTRKYWGEFENRPDIPVLFRKLCTLSPAPYAALLNLDGHWVLSSSPEQFLHFSPDTVSARPIKGTYARSEDPTQDQANYEALKNSKKDRGENLMIVDLMRNDLSKHAQNAAVEVPELFEITAYKTVFQMSSTIQASRLDPKNTLSIIRDCFPPGSMTGAPKRQAIRYCSKLESWNRGLYSGSIGYLDGSGNAELSVLIRSIFIEGSNFEFQVGGAITALSDPIKEWEETLIKAKGISQSLGLPIESLH